MHVHGPSHVHGAHGVNAPHAPRLYKPSSDAAPTSAGSDQLEISPAAEAAVRADETGGVRTELVSRLRSEIAAGTYDSPEKLDLALDRLLDEIG